MVHCWDSYAPTNCTCFRMSPGLSRTSKVRLWPKWSHLCRIKRSLRSVLCVPSARGDWGISVNVFVYWHIYAISSRFTTVSYSRTKSVFGTVFMDRVRPWDLKDACMTSESSRRGVNPLSWLLLPVWLVLLNFSYPLWNRWIPPFLLECMWESPEVNSGDFQGSSSWMWEIALA